MSTDSLQVNTRKGTAAHSYDAIVIGSGISGGWAAKELCEQGMKTLLLERGKDVVHLRDYPTATKNPWDFTHRGEFPLAFSKENPIAGTADQGYAVCRYRRWYRVRAKSGHQQCGDP